MYDLRHLHPNADSDTPRFGRRGRGYRRVARFLDMRPWHRWCARSQDGSKDATVDAALGAAGQAAHNVGS